ncbi:MAG: aminopeptidase N [Desulfuromonadales bacterium]
MTESRPRPVYLDDYTPPPFMVDEVDLHFDLGEDSTTVHSRLKMRRNPDNRDPAAPLVLYGSELKLTRLQLDGGELDTSAYEVDGEELRITELPESFLLEVTTEIRPQDNTSLEGLYRAGGIFCTQCEPQGFRKITYYPDRPDVMASYTTTIVADRKKYPVLLSNGNLVHSEERADGRNLARWVDPFRKPSYLFALVAGDLVSIEDSYTTASGREVTLRIYVEECNRDKCDHAMRSLKKAMKWDEETYGLEYDLDIYMILAVDAFNMGAMENKGLNIFNSKYVLARPDTATDNDFQAIEEVVGHEYFHNWTGNRVTCRDWFQLSLKEGLTVFRDQEFAADMTSRAVKRIDDVRLFQNTQFPEDSGPMAHPVRPDSYVEINNFYTTTVYNKGAEVIRMYQTLLGPDLFREGVRLYLERHDGEAATTDDFLGAMTDAGGIDLDQFRLWYSQAGTPELEVETDYDAAQQTFRLTVNQSIPPTPGQPEKKPMLIPFAVGLVGADGQDLPLQLTGENRPAEDTTRVLPLREAGQSFTFVGVAQEPILSPLRKFSAPVKLKMESDRNDLAFRLAHDSDPFNRWEAGQQLSGDILLELVGEFQASRPMVLPPVLVEAFAAALADTVADPALIAQTLTLPTESFMAEQMKEIDPEAIHEARQFARRELARQLRKEWDLTRQHLKSEQEYSLEPAEVGQRSLKNLALAYLALLEDEPLIEMVMDQFRSADNSSNARFIYYSKDSTTDRNASFRNAAGSGCFSITGLSIKPKE